MTTLKDDVRRLVDMQFLKSIEEMRSRGMSEQQIAEFLDIESVSKLRTVIAIIKGERDTYIKETVKTLRQKGYSMGAISTELDIPVSTIQKIVKDMVV